MVEKANDFFRRRAVILCALLVLGGLARLALVFYSGDKLHQPDEGGYTAQADYLYRHGFAGYSDMGTDRTPGTASVILLAYLASGASPLNAKILFALISTAAIFAVFKYAEDLAGPRPALIAAAVTAAYPFFIYWSGILTTETVSVFFTVCSLFFTSRFAAGRNGRFMYAALGGFSWALLILIRAQNVYFLPFLLGFLLLRKSYKKPAALLLFLLLTVSLPALWMFRNYRNTGRPALDTHGGEALLVNTVFHDESRIDWGLGIEALQSSEIFKEASKMSLPERDSYYREKAVEYIKAHPGRFLTTRLNNFIQFWRFYPRTDLTVSHGSPFMFMDRKSILFTIISLMTEPWLILLGLFGLLSAVRNREEGALLPLLFVLFTTSLHTLVFSQMRYRLVIMPILIIFTVNWVGKFYREERRALK